MSDFLRDLLLEKVDGSGEARRSATLAEQMNGLQERVGSLESQLASVLKFVTTPDQ